MVILIFIQSFSDLVVTDVPATVTTKGRGHYAYGNVLTIDEETGISWCASLYSKRRKKMYMPNEEIPLGTIARVH